MFKDEEVRKFVLYSAATGILIVLMACILQLCLVPGSECKIPFVSVDDTKFLTYENPPKNILNSSADYQAILYTTEGKITIDLFEINAPDTVNNFVFLASEGYYNEVTFHRLFKDLLVQTGDQNTLDNDPDNDGRGSPGYVIDDEINWETSDIPEIQQTELENEGYSSTPGIVSKKLIQYSIAMANAGTPNTNGSQFFIVLADSFDTRIASLRGRHTVFGRVIEGYDVLTRINSYEVDETDPDKPTPTKDIKIEKVDILEILPDNNTNDSSLDQTVKIE